MNIAMKQIGFLLSELLANPVILITQILLILFYSPVYSPVSASLYNYDVAMDDVDWQLHEDKYFKCRLYQKVPLFGGVAIVAEAGHQQFIELESSLFPTRPESVQVWIKPQPWGQAYISESPGSSDENAAKTASDLSGQQLQVIYYQLSDNFQVEGLELKLKLPVRLLLDRLDSRSYLSVYIVNRLASNDIEVRIPTVGMLPAMEKMSDCIISLLPRNFQQLHQYNLHYALGKYLLNNNQRQWLLDTARYVAVDKSINEITIDGNSDNTPFRDSDETIDRLQNLELSKKRADVVRNQLQQYLKEASIARPVNIVTRYHGERYPIASNATAAGRYENRRVEVTLLRDVTSSQAEEPEGSSSY
ncbi:OmpA family protein [Endozoicomonas sp. SCSIO W0465]|uniref:MotY family protein n=1 Tax=Endozoicomonas sp. SCSIO W0465 TaxID=2918516 RepID=UPI0020756F45|nr:OmpA family protein [Endozoicomonas sp. SCSIO W0465]USE38255.1 OmpA family protein [Endozoicomonas sp. SCSIO W0465]